MLDVTVSHCAVLSGVRTWSALLWGGPSSLENQCQLVQGDWQRLGQCGWKDDKCLLEATDVTSNISQSFSKMSMGEDNSSHAFGLKVMAIWTIRET